MKTILIIDDCADDREILGSYLLTEGFEVLEASCPDEAFPLLLGAQVDLVMCDLLMPFALGMKGLDYEHSHEVGVKMMQELVWALPQLPIIAVSAAPIIAMRSFLNDLEVTSLCKPVRKNELLSLVNRMLAPTQAPGVTAAPPVLGFDA